MCFDVAVFFSFLQYFDDGSFIRPSVHAAIISCSEKVLKTTSLHDDAGNPPAFIATDLCPDYDCSDHGTCDRGTCVCDTGYAGDACEIDTTTPPYLYSVVR